MRGGSPYVHPLVTALLYIIGAFGITFLAAILFAVSLLILPAHGHGLADWIQRHGFKNAIGELCCGERDCFELSDSDVKVTPAGYFIVSIKETIPFEEATPSPTGTYWRCFWGGKRKCFFAPPGST